MSEIQKVLIIDDEDLVRDALAMVLERQGFLTKAVDSAIAALQVLAIEEYDVILSDIVMPEMDGVSFIKELRNRGDFTPVITLTGGARLGQANMSNQALKAGACRALRKPVNKQQILDAIDFALNG